MGGEFGFALLTVLAGFATRTSRLLLGTDIVVAAFHHPVRLAEDVAMLDVMSNGRAILGIAIGYKPDEFALYGIDLEKRGARFEEQCVGRPTLHGKIHWAQGDPTAPPGVVYPPPAGLWDAPAGSTPAAGS